MAAAPLDPERIFCVVPARSGSTRVRDKNLALVGGSSLLERAVHVARAAVGRVVVSTDSDRYAEVARRAGADVPALRPAALAASDVPMEPVVAHALRAWSGRSTEIVLVVQPTAPFTSVDDLVAVVDAYDETPGAASALTAVAVPPTTAFTLVTGPDGTGVPLVPSLFDRRTQDVPPLANATGAAFVAPVERVVAGGPLVEPPIALAFVDPSRAIDVDDEQDLARARELAS